MVHEVCEVIEKEYEEELADLRAKNEQLREVCRITEAGLPPAFEWYKSRLRKVLGDTQ